MATSKNFIRAVLLFAGLLASTAIQAHLVLAQRGSVNIVGDRVYVEVSLPASAFTGVDDDGDGRISAAEWDAHRGAIEARVRDGVALFYGDQALAPDGLLLSPSPPELDAAAPASQVVVQARFTLPAPNVQAELRIGVYGVVAGERLLDVVVTKGAEKQLIRFEPDHARNSLLPSRWRVFADCVRLGAEHILSGADHLLFLLVVVSAGWSARRLMLALTAFTLGHALTLSASVFGWLSVAPNVVEPAIAATIVGMALLDNCSVQCNPSFAARLRLALVFGCSLIHGLGLAGALLDLGLDDAHRIVSLAGFNLGIELAQVAVAAVALGLQSTLRHVLGAAAVRAAARISTGMAIAAGSIWFVQRLATVGVG